MNRPPPGHQAHLDAMMREHLKLLGELVNARRNELKMSQAEAAAWVLAVGQFRLRPVW